MDYLQLLAGFAVLLAGGELLIRGSVGLAQRFGVPQLIIGLTIVAFGTSAPELVISLSAAFEGSGGIAIGNVIGSNIANVLLVLAIPSLLRPTACDEPGLLRNAIAMLGFTALFMAMLATGTLGRFDGLILFSALSAFTYSQIRSVRNKKAAPPDLPTVPGPDRMHRLIALTVAGLVLLPVGADLAVLAAVRIAESWGVSEDVIGLTIVAAGTSLPELAASVIALSRGQSALALGSVVGSNIFNIGGIIGVSATVFPLTVAARMTVLDMWVMAIAAVLIAGFVFWRRAIGRNEGLAMLAAYCIYVLAAYAY